MINLYYSRVVGKFNASVTIEQVGGNAIYYKTASSWALEASALCRAGSLLRSAMTATKINSLPFPPQTRKCTSTENR